MTKRKAGFLLLFLGCLAAAVCLSLFIRVPAQTQSLDSPKAKAPSLRLSEANAQADNLILEQIQAYDPTPLFLPTQWNISNVELPEVIQDTAAEAFANIPPHLLFGERKVPVSFPLNVAIPEKSMNLLQMRHLHEIPILIGQSELSRELLQPRMAFLSVYSLSAQKEALSTPLPPPAAEESPPPLRRNWQPLQFMAIITSVGLESGLMISNSSGTEEIDDYFRNYLTRTYRIGAKLPPGTYFLNIGP